MSAVPEEVMREVAATSEPPRGLASQEFFFLLQRIDRVDEKLSARIDQLDEKLTGEIKAVESKLGARVDRVEEKLSGEIGEIRAETRRLDQKLDNLRFWAVGTMVAIVVGFAGTIVALVTH
ncbi:MAG: hypothetical protein AB1327_00880 [Bacillota bacterium]